VRSVLSMADVSDVISSAAGGFSGLVVVVVVPGACEVGVRKLPCLDPIVVPMVACC
jgi:hypothetical protein